MTVRQCVSTSKCLTTPVTVPQALASFDLLVTSNGTQFDLPVEGLLPRAELTPAHGLDLAVSSTARLVQGGAEDRAQIFHPSP